jgi:glucokinase
LEKKLVLAGDLGGTNFRSAVVDETGKIYGRLKRETPRTESKTQFLRELAEQISELIASTQTEGQIRAVTLAVPATVDVKSGHVMKAPNLPVLNDFKLSSQLSELIDIPVVLENDANAAAAGEMWLGAAKGYSTVICLTLGTGVGGGIILDGELWRGIDGTAAEIGHLVVEPEGVKCGCGGWGCLEVYSSATGIVRMARELIGKEDSSLRDKDLTAETIAREAAKGDKVSVEVYRRAGCYLGIALVSLINLLNPEVIVIGGGVAAGWDLFIHHIKEQVNSRAFAVPAKRAQIVPALCGDDAGLIGAAHIAFGKI